MATQPIISNPPNIYCFSGKLGSGKNYISEQLFKPLLPQTTLVVALGDAVKIEACCKHNIAFGRVFHKKDSESRTLLQTIGTEKGRDVYGKDIWVKALLTTIEMYAGRGITDFIVTDVRFKNEVKLLRNAGAYIIRINATDRTTSQVITESCGSQSRYNEIITHSSETDLDTYTDFDLVINNDICKDQVIRDTYITDQLKSFLFF